MIYIACIIIIYGGGVQQTNKVKGDVDLHLHLFLCEILVSPWSKIIEVGINSNREDNFSNGVVEELRLVLISNPNDFFWIILGIFPHKPPLDPSYLHHHHPPRTIPLIPITQSFIPTTLSPLHLFQLSFRSE